VKYMPGQFEFLGRILDKIAEEYSEKRFLLFQEKSYTYKQTNEHVNQLANGLYEIGVRKGQKVALFSPNSDFFVFTLFALLKIGAVAVPVNIHQRKMGLSYIINQSDAEVLIYTGDLHEYAMDVQSELVKIKKVVTYGMGELESEVWQRPYFQAETFFKTAPSHLLFHYPDIHPLDPSEIIYTSGTTGVPKGAIWNHKKITSNMAGDLGFTSEDIFYTCLPLFHGLAQSMLFMSLLSNATFALSSKFSARNFWREVNFYRATWFNHIGGIIPILLKQPEESDISHSAKYSYGCGAPQDPADWKRFEERFGVRIVEYYGSTEAGAVTVGSKPGSIGKPRGSQLVKIVNDDDQECNPNEVGEIISKPRDPDLFFPGYYKMPEATKEKTKGGWIRSGDLAYRDEEGYYHFVGRRKESIRRRGENISPWEIETIVNAHPCVKESAAVAVPSELGEDDVKICVVLTQAASLTEEELIQYCKQRMGYYLVPRYVEFKESLPKTPTEKIERLKLKQEGITANTWDRERNGFCRTP